MSVCSRGKETQRAQNSGETVLSVAGDLEKSNRDNDDNHLHSGNYVFIHFSLLVVAVFCRQNQLKKLTEFFFLEPLF